MVGYILEAVADSIAKWELLQENKVFPYIANDGQTKIDNVTPPAVALELRGITGHGNTYIGGGIRQYFELHLHCILPVYNYTFSRDKGLQKKTFDLSDEVLRCLEKSISGGVSDIMDYVKVEHDFNAQYSETDIYRTYGHGQVNSIEVDVHDLVYKCDVEFNPNAPGFEDWILLKRVEIDNNGINKIIINDGENTTV